MILHHYTISPYSEMIRLMFGYTGLAWQSAISPPMPPRPKLDPLVGGYRRIPVAQIGADLFCDTRIIANEISALTDKSALSFERCARGARDFALHTNGQVFMPVVQGAVPKSVLAMLVTKYWPWQIMRLMKDRATVAKNSSLPRQSRQERQQVITTFKQDLNQRAGEHDFLFGDEPSVADFSAYHLVWFANLTRPDGFLEVHQDAQKWFEKMQRFGHGTASAIGQAHIFESARESQPRALSSDQLTHADIGRAVSVKPNDYAQNAVTGQLVGADDERWIVARQSEEFGSLNVHFPREGYDLKVLN